jgi:hypothetical protein
MPLYGLARSEFPTVIALTASATQALDQHGVWFTNRGASGAVVLTLPPVTGLPVGFGGRLTIVADQTVTIASNGSLDNIIGFNDAAADSIAFSTAAEKLGNTVEWCWDGTSWLLAVSLAAETATPTYA